LSYPELYSDERVVLQAQNVKVKSVVFEVVLTTRRLVLIDSKKGSIPPQEINLATLKDVESGENAIRDPTITISIITISGNTRQMVLTFSKTSGGERRREADEWVRALRQNITSTVYHPVSQVPVPKEPEPVPAAQPPVIQPQAVQMPPHPPQRVEITSTTPPKKRIEIARPVKKIMEPVPAMPAPVETTSLPTGSFCNRCGNRVPPDSAFCNHCGTPVVQDTGFAVQQADYDTISFEPAAPPAPPVPPAVPQVHVTPSPVFPTIADKKDRPIEEVIHSIEPLIEDSVPRTAPAPLIPARQTYYPQPADAAEAAVPSGEAEQPPVQEAGSQPADGVQWPVLTKSGMSDVVAPPAPVPPSGQAAVMPPPPAAPRTGYGKLIAGIVIILVLVIAGAFVFLHIQNPAPAPEPAPTPQITVQVTTALPSATATMITTAVPVTTQAQQVSTPQVLIPTSGVWVKVTYSGKFSGSVGTPNYQQPVEWTGDKLYQISTSKDPVLVSLQKTEGSSAPLNVDVYKDGTLIGHSSTSAPKGVVEFQTGIPAGATATAAVTATPAPGTI